MSTSDNRDEAVPTSFETSAAPANVHRRAFVMRSAVIGAAAVMTGKTWTREARAEQAAKEAAAPKLGSILSADLNVVKKSKGPVMTVADEFYRWVPAPQVRIRSDRCALPMTFTSVARSCRPTNWHRPRD